MDEKLFKEYGYKFIDWIAEYFDTLQERPVCADVNPGDVLKQLPASPPREGEDLGRIFADFQQIILPGMTHWQHPSWFAYFAASNSAPSILAELLTAGMGAQCMIWQTSPAATELEEQMVRWLGQMLGLPSTLSGVIQDTASTATLVALLSAREKATGFSSNERGLDEQLVVYASREAHSSVDKGVRIAGLGQQNLRRIATDDDYAMQPEALRRAIEQDKAAGLRPACVVATVGTTSSTAIDPIEPIGRICTEHNIWLHVDAAYAGTAAILPEKQWIFAAAEAVDSLVFNPHKWMMTNFDCSVYFVKDAEQLTKTFEIHPEYLKTGVDARVKNYRDWGIQLGRRFRALKLWFVIRYYGISGLQQVIREHLRLARLFEGWVKDHPHFELMAPVPFSVVCFRLNDGRDAAALNDLNAAFYEKLSEQQTLHLTHTSLNHQYVLRMAIGSRTTAEKHVTEAWRTITETASTVLN